MSASDKCWFNMAALAVIFMMVCAAGCDRMMTPRSTQVVKDADAKAATDAANTAAADAVAVGCALNNLSDQLGTASPYTPPSGTTCPPFSGGS